MSRLAGKIRADYRAQNQAAASIILADPCRYGGADSLAVRWSWKVIFAGATEAKGGKK